MSWRILKWPYRALVFPVVVAIGAFAATVIWSVESWKDNWIDFKAFAEDMWDGEWYG